MPFLHFKKAVTIGTCGTLLLHAAALFFILHFLTPGAHYQRTSTSQKTTFYVGLGQAGAARKPVVSSAAPRNSPSGEGHEQRGSGMLGTPAPDVNGKDRPQHTRDEDVSRFFAPEMLDNQAMYASDPEYFLLDGLPGNKEPIRLRLYIDETGNLVDIAILKEDERDRELGLRIRAMFSTSHFLPGRIQNRYVASYIDIEINVNGADVPKPTRPH